MNNYDLKISQAINHFKYKQEIITVRKMASLLNVSRQFVYFMISKSNYNFKNIIKKENDIIKKQIFNNLPSKEKRKIRVIEKEKLQRKENSRALKDMTDDIEDRVSQHHDLDFENLTKRQILEKLGVQYSLRAVYILTKLEIPYNKKSRIKKDKTIQALSLLKNINTDEMTLDEISQETGLDKSYLRQLMSNYKINHKRSKSCI